MPLLLCPRKLANDSLESGCPIPSHPLTPLQPPMHQDQSTDTEEEPEQRRDVLNNSALRPTSLQSTCLETKSAQAPTISQQAKHRNKRLEVATARHPSTSSPQNPAHDDPVHAQ